MDASEVEARSERETIVQLEQQRNGYNAGSAEYKKMDEELARKLADFNLKMTRLRKDFLEREAKIYYQAYLEINDAIKYYAAERNIGLVIRFNGDPVDPNRPESVQREINKPIVFQNQVDITPDILARLGRDSASSATRPQAPGSSIPRTR
jgi:Skp family chaperone for outer membrane proteins